MSNTTTETHTRIILPTGTSDTFELNIEQLTGLKLATMLAANEGKIVLTLSEVIHLRFALGGFDYRDGSPLIKVRDK